MNAFTDPSAPLAASWRPEICNVYAMHKMFARLLVEHDLRTCVTQRAAA